MHLINTACGNHGSLIIHWNFAGATPDSLKRGEPQLSVTIVPDSGTGELEGISGSLTIDIRDGKHFSALAYSF